MKTAAIITYILVGMGVTMALEVRKAKEFSWIDRAVFTSTWPVPVSAALMMKILPDRKGGEA